MSGEHGTISTVTIEEFIEARLAEDEATAQAAIERDEKDWHVTGSPGSQGVQAGGELGDLWDDGNLEWTGGYTVVYGEGYPSDRQAEHIARHDPQRALYEVECKREILAFHGGTDYCCYCSGELEPVAWPCEHVRRIAAVWRAHPDYFSEWHPPDAQ